MLLGRGERTIRVDVRVARRFECNCDAINSLSTFRVESFDFSTAPRPQNAMEKGYSRGPKTWPKWRVKTTRFCVARAGSRPPVFFRPRANSCTSVHNRSPQVCDGAYPCRRAHLAGCRHFSTCAIHKNDNDLWKTFLLCFESGFSRLPPPPTAKSPTRSKIAHLKSCISSAARLRLNRLKMRQRRRFSATSPRASVGMDFGRRYLTGITCGARGPAERSSGSSSLMMSRLPRRAAKHVCSLCTQSREDTRASTS